MIRVEISTNAVIGAYMKRARTTVRSAKNVRARQSSPQLFRRRTPVLELQRTIGNRAVQRLIETMLGLDRQHVRDQFVRQVAGGIVHRLTAEERAENLQSPRFAGNTRLEAVFDNAPPMSEGESGEPVKIVQQALIDDGFSMPISIRKLGEPDGI